MVAISLTVLLAYESELQASVATLVPLSTNSMLLSLPAKAMKSLFSVLSEFVFLNGTAIHLDTIQPPSS